MAITMYKGKISKVVDNRDVRQHRKDGWTFHAVKEPVKSKRKPKATLKVEPEVLKTTIEDLPGPEDFQFNTQQED